MKTVKARVALCLCMSLCLAGALHADTRWTAAADDSWSNPANWTDGVPTIEDKAQFTLSGLPTCILDVEGAQAKHIAVGDGGGGRLHIVGGSLTVRDWSIIGYAQDNVGDEAGWLDVSGGVLNCQARLFVGFMGEGHLTVDKEGTINVHNQTFGLGEDGGSGLVNLDGGELNLYGGPLSLSLYNGTANMDFWGGVLTLPNTPENRDYLNRAIGDGILTAYSGAGEIVMDTETTPGRIAVRGLHALKPFPADNTVVSAGDIELCWVLPDPCQPGKPVVVDVYFGTDPQIGSVRTPKVVSKQAVASLAVQTTPKTRYYWAVDVYVGGDQDPAFGPAFTFIADNIPPKVAAGDDVMTWLKEGSAVVNLDGAVTDDGFPQPYTVQWTVVSEPNEGAAVLDGADADSAVATLGVAGQYVMQLQASDGEYSGSDTVTISVYADSCEAAKSLPDFVPLPGDLNGDCRVDDLDLAILQAHWLECNALDCGD